MAVAALVGTALLVPAVGADEPPPPEWHGQSTMLGGTAQVDTGEWIHQDSVYDDYGASTSPASTSNVVTLAPTSGNFRYPAGEAYANNAADIVEVRVRPDGDDLEVRVTLNTLVDPAVPVVGIAVDTGGGTEQAWPHGAGVTSPWDHFATVAEGEARLEPDGAVLAAIVDTNANTIDVRLPGLAAGSSIGLNVGAGLWDADAGEWMAGSPAGLLPGTFNSGGVTTTRVFDLAFNTRELEPRGGAWQEDAQSEALLLGDVGDFTQTVDLDLLRTGESVPYEIGPGYYNGLFWSIQDLGEGVASSFPQYRGRIQPYGLWVPSDFDASTPTPLFLALHSLSVHHNQYRGGDLGNSYRTFYEQLPDELGAIAVTPLGRGPDGWYRNEALVDTLEVLADVHARFDVDEDRVWIGGYSMGGYGTYRLGTLLPDRFAAAISWAGVPTDGDRLDNMTWVPTQIIHGTNDELVPVTGVRNQAARFAELGHEYRYYEHPGQDHFTFVFLDHWQREADWYRDRVAARDPHRVSFAVQPSMWTTVSGDRRDAILASIDALGVDLRSAYWVRDVLQRGGDSTTAQVDVTSLAHEDRVPSTTPVDDSVGFAPEPGMTPYLIEGQDRSFGPAPTSNGLVAELTAVASVGLDVARAGLDVDDELRVEVTTDGETVLRLLGGFAPGTTVVDADTGEELPATVEGGAVTVTLDEGAHTLLVTPGDDAGDPDPGDPDPGDPQCRRVGGGPPDPAERHLPPCPRQRD